MKQLFLIIALAAFVGCNSTRQVATTNTDMDVEVAEVQTLLSEMDSVSYSLGTLIAQNLKSQGFEGLEAESIAKGIDDALNGTPKFSPEQAGAYVQQYQEKVQAKMNAKQTEYLTENRGKTGVTELPSGLQYTVLQEGTGKSPSATDKVTVHYTGTTIDGKVFDSSVQRGQPATFGVNQVIAGWTEALQLMKEGSKWELVIPSNLAYGQRGAGADIGPGATLIFEVELIKVN